MPCSLIGQWKDEIAKFAPGMRVQIDNLDKGTQFNGTVGTIVAFSKELDSSLMGQVVKQIIEL